MRTWIKILLAALGGFGGGFASGFFLHKKLNDLKFQEISEEEMKAIEESEAKKEKKDIPSPVTKIEKVPDIPIEALPENPDELRNALQGKTPYMDADAEQKKAYEKMWNTVRDYSNEENADRMPVYDIPPDEESEDDDPDSMEEEPEDDDEIERLEEEAEAASSYKPEPPHPISLFDFYNSPEYDKITIDWYEPDNVWLDEREEIIPDPVSYVGTDVKSLFAKTGQDEDPDVRFVRNDRYQTDYEVIRHHKSYKELMGG